MNFGLLIFSLLWIVFGVSLSLVIAHWTARKNGLTKFGTPDKKQLRLFGSDSISGIPVLIPEFTMPSVNGGLPSEASLGPINPLKPSNPEIAGILDGLTYGGAIFAAVHRAQPVYETLGRLGHEFGHKVPLTAHVFASHAAKQGYQSWLQGHVGETIAAQSLQSAGHSVTWATASNQPGWDLIVDGHKLNVKAGDSASQMVRHHLMNHPGIGAITDPKTAAQFAHAHSPVIGLPSLDPHHLQHVMHAAQTAHGAYAGWSLHFPWFTALFAIGEEIKISRKHGVNYRESISTVSAKTASVLAGGKAGAVGGFLVSGPIGSVFGAAIGSLAGACGINSALHRIAQGKRKNFEEYIQKMQIEWQEEDRKFKGVILAIVARWQEAYSQEIQQIESRLNSYMSGLHSQLLQNMVQLGKATFGLFDRLHQNLIDDRITLNEIAPARPMLAKIFLPRWQDTYRAIAIQWLDTKSQFLDDIKGRLEHPIAELELGNSDAYAEVAKQLEWFTTEYSIADETLAREASVWLKGASTLTGEAKRLVQTAEEEAAIFAKQCSQKIDIEAGESWSLNRNTFLDLLSEAEKVWKPVARKLEISKSKASDPLKPYRDYIAQLDNPDLVTEEHIPVLAHSDQELLLPKPQL